MHFKSQKTIILIVSVLLLVFIIPNYSFASNYDRTYTFNVKYGYHQFSRRLHISVPPSLYDYYHSKSHRIYRDSDYSKFVTPNAVKSIAESIQNVTRKTSYSDEQFANAVLMLVHQIPYVKSNAKYPAETIVDNSGDCDVLSYLAASIMKAGGLDVVLLYYKERSPSHMNVGVHLPYTPVYHTWRMTPKYYEYKGKKYWMAECTSGGGSWKVGDQPSKFAGAEPRIIPLKNYEKSSPAHVSSSLNSPLIPSSISISLSPEPSNVEERARTLTISGSISPEYSGKSVAMYVGRDGSSYNTFRTVTDDLGKYSLTWNFTSTGTYYIRTSWSGASNYAGADSETLTVFIGPESLVQFRGPGYNYIYGLVSVAAYELRIRRGVNEFLNIHLSGTGVLLTGEFIILRSEQTIRLPRSEPTITTLGGVQPLRLPDDFDLTINDQFGFILRHNGGNNYSVCVRGLNYYDISQINQLDGNGTVFMNASMGIIDNTWYTVVARMSQGEITAELYDMNGTLLESIATRNDTVSVSEFAILIANNTDAVIAFKNLKVEIVDQSTQPVGGNNIPVYRLEWRRGG